MSFFFLHGKIFGLHLDNGELGLCGLEEGHTEHPCQVQHRLN